MVALTLSFAITLAMIIAVARASFLAEITTKLTGAFTDQIIVAVTLTRTVEKALISLGSGSHRRDRAIGTTVSRATTAFTLLKADTVTRAVTETGRVPTILTPKTVVALTEVIVILLNTETSFLISVTIVRTSCMLAACLTIVVSHTDALALRFTEVTKLATTIRTGTLEIQGPDVLVTGSSRAATHKHHLLVRCDDGRHLPGRRWTTGLFRAGFTRHHQRNNLGGENPAEAGHIENVQIVKTL